MSAAPRARVACGLALSVLATACAVKLNGKTYGAGSGAGSSPGVGAREASVPATGTSSAPAPTVSTTCTAPTGATWDTQPAVLTRPADPWHAVHGDQPAVVPIALDHRQRILARQDVTTCDAAHDHCLRDCTWLFEFDSHYGAARSRRDARRDVVAGHFLPDGKIDLPRGGRANDGYPENGNFIAYRTVPATRALLREGALLVVRLEPSESVPRSEADGLGLWQLGVLGEVDWDAQQVYLQRVATPYHLSAVRVAVLTYAKGGAVALAPGLSKADLAIDPEALFRPRAEAP